MAALIGGLAVWLAGLLTLMMLAVPLLTGGRAVSELAYYAQQQRGGAIYLLDVERMLSARLYRSRDWVLSMAWSPDGTQLAFTAQEENNSQLLVMDANGRHLRQLVERGAGNEPLSWSADGRYIVFESSQAASTVIRAVDVETGETHSLTERLGELSTDFRWSPDGQQAVFAVHQPDNNTFDLYIMNRDCIDDPAQCDFRRLTESAADDRVPEWSPDGDRVAFLSDRNGPLQLYVMDAHCEEDTCATERLLDAEVNASTLAWSPAGRWLVFGISAGGYGSLLHLVDMNCNDCDTPIYRITPDGDVDSAAAWSPDGAQLAYVSSGPGQLANVVVLDIDCVEQDTCAGAGRRLTGGVFRAWFPAWRPVG